MPATIEVLPEIARAVGNKVEIYLDGGITRGTDVLKVRSFDDCSLALHQTGPGSRSSCSIHRPSLPLGPSLQRYPLTW